MKTAFRVILACFLAAPALISCAAYEDSDPEYATYYTYSNQSLLEVTVEIYYTYYSGQASDTSVFVLPGNGGEHTLLFCAMGAYIPPFSMYYLRPEDDDSLVIINGHRRVVQRYRDNAELYNAKNYTLVSKEENSIRYLFTFTDSFFDQGEPLSP